MSTGPTLSSLSELSISEYRGGSTASMTGGRTDRRKDGRREEILVSNIAYIENILERI